jgi:hypothetical protein
LSKNTKNKRIKLWNGKLLKKKEKKKKKIITVDYLIIIFFFLWHIINIRKVTKIFGNDHQLFQFRKIRTENKNGK